MGVRTRSAGSAATKSVKDGAACFATKPPVLELGAAALSCLALSWLLVVVVLCLVSFASGLLGLWLLAVLSGFGLFAVLPLAPLRRGGGRGTSSEADDNDCGGDIEAGCSAARCKRAAARATAPLLELLLGDNGGAPPPVAALPAAAALEEPADLKSTGPLPPTPTREAPPALRGDVEAAAIAAVLLSVVLPPSAPSSVGSVTPRAPRPIQALSGVGVRRRGELDDRRLCSASALLPLLLPLVAFSLPPARLRVSLENFSSFVGGVAGGGRAAEPRPDRTASGGGDAGGAMPTLVLTGVVVVVVVVWMLLALPLPVVVAVAALLEADKAVGGAVSGGAIALGRKRLRLLLRLLLRAGLLLVLLLVLPALPPGVLLLVGAGGARVDEAVSKRRRLS